MIEFIKEKSFSTKNLKTNIMKHKITLAKFRIPQFVSSCHYDKYQDGRLVLFLGMTNGNIIALVIYKQKRLYKQYDDFILYKSPPKQKHDGAVNVLVCEKLLDSPHLFSAGADGTIKLWTGDPELKEKDMMHFLDTVYQDNSTVTELLFFKKQNILIGAFSDMTIKILLMKEYVDKKKTVYPKFNVISVIRDFDIKLKPNKIKPQNSKQFLITSLSLKESDINELYVSDNQGRVLTYHYIDDNYLKYKGPASGENPGSKNFVNGNFKFYEKINLHKKFGVIKVLHNIYDNIIYTAGYDNHIICYNTKNQQKIFDILSSNTKTHISTMYLNYVTKELLIADDAGNLTFLDIFTKSEFKYKPMSNKIISIQKLNIFPKEEHLFLMTEDNMTVFKLNRKHKVAVTQHHDAEIMKIFAVEPVTFENCIIEDAKIISAGFDNKIKMWDFLTMENINEINGPELPKIPVDVSSVAYLNDSALIAIGTEVGHVFFYDLNKSEYLPITYEDKYIHKGVVTNIICFTTKGKDNLITECLLSCSTDSLILFWEINKMEIKEPKKKNDYNYEESDEKIFQVLKGKKKDIQTKNNNEPDLTKLLQSRKRKELKIYKCTPGIKKCINAMKLIKTELKFNVIAFQSLHNHTTLFSGLNSPYVYLWDYDKENFVSKIEGKNAFITCMTIGGENLLTGGIDGFVDVWQIEFDNKEKEKDSDEILINHINEEKKVQLKLIFTIKDPDVVKNTPPRINELTLLPKVNILVFCNNNKKIYFWDFDKKELVATLKKDTEITCMNCLESYGKLICGTKQKMILEINLNDVLEKAGYKEIYDKYPFTKNKENYEEDDIDKAIDNFKIMKSLTGNVDEFKI